jgi:hypothetical protein
VDSTYSVVDEVNQAAVFDDASTVQISALYSNRGNVYIGRSDGKLLKGVRTLWQRRSDFGNSNELNNMTVITRSTTDNVVLSGGVLNVTNAIIRV